MNDSPASVLFDSDGNAIGVVLDGTVYRLQTAARLVVGPSDKQQEYVDSPIDNSHAEMVVTNTEVLELLHRQTELLEEIADCLKAIVE
jgi:hypothetical protein